MQKGHHAKRQIAWRQKHNQRVPKANYSILEIKADNERPINLPVYLIKVWQLQPRLPKDFQPIRNHSFNKELGVQTSTETVLFFDWLVLIHNDFAI